MIADLRTKAESLARESKFADALQIMNNIVEQQLQPLKRDLELCGYYAWNLSKFNKALSYFERIYKEAGASPVLLKNMAACYAKLNRYDQTIDVCKKLLQLGDATFRTYDAMTYAYIGKGEFKAAISYGDKAVTALAASIPYQPKKDLSPRKPFNPEKKTHNIISFSLWGDKKSYLRGAVQNAILAHCIYPSWQCRFYIDESVPEDVQKLLIHLQAQVVKMPLPKVPFEGLGWRFQVWDDPDVDFCIIRDCDSVISVFEAMAVHEWLASESWFHVMRCWYSHTDLILAGLWGGATGVLKNVYPAYIKNCARYTTPTVDQEFLRSFAWPIVMHHALIHDRFHRLANTKPFPYSQFLTGKWHVGINENAFNSKRQDFILKEYFNRCPSLIIPPVLKVSASLNPIKK